MSASRFLNRIRRLLSLESPSIAAKRKRHLRLMQLEDRRVLNASFAFNGAEMLTLDGFDGTGGTTELSMTDTGADVLFTLDAGIWAAGGSHTVNVGVAAVGNVLTVSKALFENPAETPSWQIEDGGFGLNVVVPSAVNLPDSTNNGELSISVAGAVDIVGTLATEGNNLTITAGGAVTTTAAIITAGDDVDEDSGFVSISSTNALSLGASIDTSGFDNPGGADDSAGGMVTLSGAGVTVSVIDSRGGTTMTNAGPGGVVQMTATSGDLNITNTIHSGGADVTATATLGNVDLDAGIETGGGSVLINGATVDSAAGSDIVTTSVMNNQVSGDVTISVDNGVLLLGDIDTSGFGGDADGGNVLVETVDGSISMAAVDVQATGAGTSGTINIDANGANQDVTLTNILTASGGTITIVADDVLTLQNAGDIVSSDGDVSLTAAAGNLTMATGAVVDAGTGGITASASGNLLVGQLISSGTVDLTSTNGAISDAGGAATDIIAAALALNALTGIGDDLDALETMTSVAVSTMLLAATTDSGDININHDGSLTVGTVGLVAGITITDDSGTGADAQDSGLDNITLTAASPLTVNVAITNNDGSNINLTATNDGGNDDHLTVNAALTITGGDAMDDADGNINLTAGTDLIINANATTDAAGTINATAVNDILVQTGTLQTDTAGQTLDAVGGVFTMSDGTSIQSTSGNFDLDASGNFTVAAVSTGGTVLMTSDLGAIVDGGGAATDIAANQAALTAATGIGSGDALETAIATVAFQNTVSGNVELDNSIALQIAAVGGLAASENLVGDVTLCATQLVLSSDVTLGATDTLRLSAATGGITQTAGRILAGQLGVRANNAISLSAAANDVSELAAQSLTGGVLYQDANGFTVSQVAADGCFAVAVSGVLAAGDIELCTTTGNITLNSDLNAGVNTIRLQADAGTITQSAGTITSGELGARADANISLTSMTNNVSEFSALSDTGSVEFNEVDGFTVGAVAAGTCFAAVTGVTTDNGTGGVTLLALSGNLIVDNVITTATGAIDVTASAGTVDLNAVVSATLGVIGIEGDSVTQDSNILTGGAGTIRVQADNGDVTMANATTTTSAAGQIRYDASGNVAISAISSATGNLIVEADSNTSGNGAISDNSLADAIVNLSTAGSTTLSAATGIGGTGIADIDTTIVTLQATNSTSGGILLQETNTLDLTGLIASGQDAKVTVDLGNLAISGAADTGAGNLFLDVTGNVSQAAAITADGLGLMVDGTTTLTVAGNQVSRLAAANGGLIDFVSASVLTIAPVTVDGMMVDDVVTSPVANITLTAASILDGDIAPDNEPNVDPDVDGLNVTLIATTGNIGISGADIFKGNVNPLEVRATGNLTATALLGGIALNPLVAGNTTLNSPNVALVTTGTLNIAASVTVTGDLRIEADDVIAADGTIDLAATRLLFKSGQAETINTTVEALDASAGAGGITVIETDDVDLLDLDCDNVAIESTAAAGNVSVTAGGMMTVSDDVIAGNDGSSASTGFVQLTSTGTINVNDVVLADNGNITISADDDVLFGANISANDLPVGMPMQPVDDLIVVTTVNGNIAITADADGDANGTGGALLMSNAARIIGGRDVTVPDYVPGVNGAASPSTLALGAVAKAAGQSQIALQADETISLGSVQTANATVSAVQMTSISDGLTDAGDLNVDIVANQIGAQTTILTITGVGSADDIETTVDQLDITNITSGNIQIDETDDVSLSRVLQLRREDISVIAVGNVDVLAAGIGVAIADFANTDNVDSVLLRSETGDVLVNQIVLNNSAGNVTIDADGINSDVRIDAMITSAIGDITITADDSVVMTVNGAVTANNAGNVQVQSNTTDTNGNDGDQIQMANGAVINGGTGTVTLEAQGVNGGDITLGAVQTANNTASAVLLQTSRGIIDGGNMDVDIVANVPGAVVSIESVLGVGDVNDIETQINQLNVVNTTSGRIQIDESDDINLERLLHQQDDSISVIAVGNIDVIAAGTGVIVDDSTNSNGAGEILLRSESDDVLINNIVRNDSANAAADITLDADLGNGDVRIDAAVTTVLGDVVITAADSVFIAANGSVTANGTGSVLVQSNVAVTNGNDGDRIEMNDAAVIDAGTGTITMTALGVNGGDITLGSIQTANDTVAAVLLQTNRGVIDGGDTNIDILANAANSVVSIESVLGVGSLNDIETQVDQLNIINTATGAIRIDETDSIDVERLLQIQDDSISVIAVGIIDVIAAGTGVLIADVANANGAASILLQSESGDVLVNDVVRNFSDNLASGISLDADGTNSDVRIDAIVTTVLGGISITADDSVFFTMNGDVTAGGSEALFVQSNTTDADGDDDDQILMADGAVIDGGSGEVTLTSLGINGGNITLGAVQTTNNTASAVLLQTSLAVLDGGDLDVDIFANQANALTVIDAVTGIGSGNRLEVRLGQVDADNVDGNVAASGNIELHEVAAGGSLSVVHLDNDANPAVQDDAANGVIDVVVDSGNLVVLDNLVDNTFAGVTLTAIDAAVQSENTIRLESVANDIILLDSLLAVNNGGIDVNETIILSSRNLALASNQVISTDDDLTAGASDAASLDTISITTTTTTFFGNNVNVRTDGGVARQFAVRPQPGTTGTAFFDYDPVNFINDGIIATVQNATGDGINFLSEYEVLIGVDGEENLRVDIDWRDPTGGGGVTADASPTEDRLQSFHTDGDSVSTQTLSHIYNITDFDFFTDAGVTNFVADFSVSHHESINIESLNVAQPVLEVVGGSNVVSSTDDPATGTISIRVTDPGGPILGGVILDGAAVTDDVLSDTDLHFENGLLEIVIPTAFPPIIRIDPELPEPEPPAPAEAPEIQVPPLTVTVAELAELTLSSYSSQSEDYFQLREADSSIPKEGYDRIDSDVGWKLLQPRRLKQWVDEEDFQNERGLELWLITTKNRNGADVTFERPVLRFDVFDEQPFPIEEEMPEEAEELRLRELDPNELRELLNSEDFEPENDAAEDGNPADVVPAVQEQSESGEPIRLPQTGDRIVSQASADSTAIRAARATLALAQAGFRG